MAGTNLRNREGLNPFLDSIFTNLFNELYSPLCRYCLNLVNEEEIAEDIVQEQFIYIWEHRERLGDISSLKSYLYTAVRNRSINHLKSRYVVKTENCIDNLANSARIGKLPDPSDLIENKELGVILAKALDKLPEKCRIIFTMKKIGEYTNKEIADHLSISVKTVENQMTIAFKKLVSYLTDHWN